MSDFAYPLHEECGVFGLYDRAGTEDVAAAAYSALYALQHRGQESCGIAVNDDGVIQGHRDLGLVNEVFTPAVLGSLANPNAHMATGHVRYATSGSRIRANAQPMIVRHGRGTMALCHNGNLTNAIELRRQLENEGAIFHGSSDTEVISHPTEGGTLYTKAELTALYDTCRRYGLPLFIDGARLGYGLMAEESDMTLPEIARLCDVFYIGGTKVGALFGEAVVIMNENLKKDFRFIMKQRGGRMAKGRLLGVQFDTLFTDDLYFKISRHAIEMAHQIRDIFVSAGYPLLFDSPTNQQYPIMSDDELAILGKNFGYEYWERVDETHSGVRFCASWATKQEHVDTLRAAVNALKK